MRIPGVHELSRDPPGPGWNNATQHETQNRSSECPAPFRNAMCEIAPDDGGPLPGLAPPARLFELSGPEARLARPRPHLLGLVVSIGDRDALLDQDRAEVPLTDAAPREASSIAVLAMRSAADRAAGDQSDEGLARALAAAIGTAASAADLVEFRGVEALQADGNVAHPERVAVDDMNRSFERPARRRDLEHDSGDQPDGEEKCGKASAAPSRNSTPSIRIPLKQRGSN
jgi:hypothetical protein